MATKIKVHFLGAAATVTGSKFIIETPESTIMIDCGMFQGIKKLRELNWESFPFNVKNIDSILLTHGHLDHVGYLPRIVKQGFSGKIIATAPTLSIARIILRDSAKIHEEEAEKANKEGYTKHQLALPFYNQKEAEQVIDLFDPEPKDCWVTLSKNISFRFRYNGHILGATFIEINIYGKLFVFSGDIGREEDPLLFSPEKPTNADYLFLESTYGNRLHPKEDLEETLSKIVKDVIHKRGNLIIPSFAVERAQMLLYTLWKLYKKNSIPNIPIIIDSPMGVNVLEVFKKYPNWHKLSLKDYQEMSNHLQFVESYRETWEVIDNPQSKIIVAGSGMITGGRVLTYLKQLIDEESTTVLLVGYQAEGTRGRDLLEDKKEIKFFGKYHLVKAEILHIESLSAHADQQELLDWISKIENPPEKVFLVHGETESMDILRKEIKNRYDWEVSIPQLNGVYEFIY